MVFDPVNFEDKKILITGPTGQVGLPVVERLAKISDVYALARFAKQKDRDKIEALGAKVVRADLADSSLDHLPDDFDYLLNFAVVKSDSFDYDLRANAEGMGRLMLHCRGVKACLHCSSAAVYQYEGPTPRKEDAPLGDHHRVLFPTYSISKIAAETVVRFVARQFNIPTTIARLSVPYGASPCSVNGGWPFFHLLMMKEGVPIDVHPQRPNYFNPIHIDDYLEKIPRLLAAATAEVTTLNFGGSEKVSIEEWCTYLAEITGIEVKFQDNDQAFGSLCIDTTVMHEVIGPTKVDWKEGLRSMVKALTPELLK